MIEATGQLLARSGRDAEHICVDRESKGISYIPLAKGWRLKSKGPYEHAEWSVDLSERALDASFARAAPLLAPDGARDVVVPAVPSREMRRLRPSTTAPDHAPWTHPLEQPLLKVPLDSAAALRSAVAVASGVRSCLVRGADGEWFRLKGAGNRDEGVLVRQNAAAAGGGAGWRDLRGVAFCHTAARELYWTRRLGEALAPAGIVGANGSLGRYLYSAPNAPFGESEALRPACIVEATLGDRRLGTHVAGPTSPTTY